jgi:hypothetical protein
MKTIIAHVRHDVEQNKNTARHPDSVDKAIGPLFPRGAESDRKVTLDMTDLLLNQVTNIIL